MDTAFHLLNSFLLTSGLEEDAPEAERSEDQTLLAAFHDGSREAFATLYRRHARAVFQFAFYMAGDADKADELTQEVFVWLILHPKTFDPARGSLPAFLGGVARKLLRRQRRTDNRWSPLEDAHQAIQAMSMAQSATQDALLGSESALDAKRLRQAITLLPLRYREVVVLCDLQEKPYAEAAHTLGCSVGTVRSRLHRGRNLLARKLKPPRF